MKTKEQVFKYLSNRGYGEEWADIVEWVKSRYGCGIKISRRPKMRSTMQEFLEWYETGTGEGDVIEGDGFIGIYHDGVFSHQISARIQEGVFLFDNDIITEWEICNQFDTDSFYENLRKNGFSYSVSLGAVVQRPLPPVNKIFAFQYSNKECVGIVRGLKDNKLRFWAALIGDKILLDTEIEKWEIDIISLNKKLRSHFDLALKSVGYVWEDNNLVQCIKRVLSGENYWYLNDRFGIVESKDKRNKDDDQRYENRNYFTDYQEALRFRDMIYKLRLS